MVYLSKEFPDACILNVKVGTNGFMGGDAGHGSKTYLEFELSGSEFEIDKSKDKIVIQVKGDAELRTMIQGLSFAAKSLELLSDSEVTHEEIKEIFC